MTAPILPHTKVGTLLEEYPELEPVLLGMSPAFAKLSNPVLRRTVAKVATLATAAKMAGMPVGRLVDELRVAAGQPRLSNPVKSAASESPAPLAGEVAETLHVDALLEGGEHPIAVVRRRLAALPDGRILRLLSSFRPEPLVETLLGEGRRVDCRRASDDVWQTDVM